MTHQQEIDTLQQRIADAERDCDEWRKAGLEVKYIEAQVAVRALELERDEKLSRLDR